MVLIARVTTYNIHYMSLLIEEAVPTKSVRQVDNRGGEGVSKPWEA